MAHLTLIPPFSAPLGLFVLLCLMVSGVVVGLMALRRRLGVAVLWLWVGALPTLMWVSSGRSWPLVGPSGERLFLGSGVIEPSLLLLLLLVYIEHGARDARRLLAGIIGIGLLFQVVNHLAAVGGTPLAAVTWRTVIAGGAAQASALAVMSVFYQSVANWRIRVPVPLNFCSAYLVGTAVDNVVFPLVSGSSFGILARINDPAFLSTKLLTVAVIGFPAALYLYRQMRLGRYLAVQQMSPLAIAGLGHEGPIPDLAVWRSVVETLGDGLTASVDGRIIFVNATMAKIAGWERPEDMFGRPFGDFVYEEDLPGLLEGQRQRQDGTQAASRFEWRLKHADGGLRTIETTATRAFLGGQHCTIAVSRDVTDERANRAALQRSNQAVRALVSAVSTLLVKAEPDTIISALSERAAQFVGARRVAFFQLGDEGLVCRHVVGTPGALRVGLVVPLDAEDALIRELPLTEALPLRVEGETVGLLLVTLDPAAPATPGQVELLETLGTLAAAAFRKAHLIGDLRDAETRYATLFDRVPTPVWFFNPVDRRIVSANQAALRRYGWSPEEFRGLTIDDLSAEGRHPGGEVGGPTDSILARHRDRKGEEFDVLVAVASVDLKGLPWGVLASVDLTLERRNQERLQNSQRLEALGRLAGGIAHDFNNILTALQVDLETLEAMHQANPELLAELAHLKAASARAADLTRQVLLFSRGEGPKRRPVRLNETILEIDRLLRRSLGPTIKLETDLSPGDLHVSADPGQLQQVVVNLALNSREAMPRGGSLTVHTARRTLSADAAGRLGLPAGSFAALAVTDTGVGMPPEVRSRAMEPFFTTKRVGQGTGLGLSIVHGVVRSHEGGVDIESAPRRGTTVTVYLPEIAPDVVQERSAPQADMRGSETVLLVDDDVAVRRAGERMLQRFGYRVVTAEDGEAAIRCLETEPGIDAVLTDMVMPRMDARDLIVVVRDRWPGLPVVLATGFDAGRLDMSGDDAFDAHVPKPYTAAEVLETLRAVLDRRRGAGAMDG